MQLSLARWRKEGSTEGAWVVREIPGVVIMRRINQGGTIWAILPVAGQVEQLSEIWG